MINEKFIELVDERFIWLVKEETGDVSLHAQEPRLSDSYDDPWGEYTNQWVSDGEWTYIAGFDALFKDTRPGKYKIRG